MTHNIGQPDPYDQTRISPTSPPPGQYGGPPPVQPFGAPRPSGQPLTAPHHGPQSRPAQPQAGQNPYAAQPTPYGQAPPYGGPQADPAGRVSSAVRTIGWVTAGFAVLTIIAAFLPWMTLGDTDVNGLGDSEYGAKDGMITLILAVIAGGFGVVSALIAKRSALHLVAGIVALVMGLLVVGTSIIDISDISDYKAFGLDVGYGLWLTLIGGIALAVAGIAGIVKRT